MNEHITSGQPLSGAKLVLVGLIRLSLVVVIWGAILFGISGHPDWLMAWLFIGIYLVTSVVTMFAIGPELRQERASAIEKGFWWDKVIIGLATLGQFGTLIVAAFDMRFGWTVGPIPLSLQIAGLVIMVSGLLVGIWAMLTNKYFSSAVRIQEDRAQAVVTNGPYRFVRHPSYVGFILFALAPPLIFGSLWAFIPAGILICTVIARTALEDKTLQEELAGYKAYAQKVRYRLLPGIW